MPMPAHMWSVALGAVALCAAMSPVAAHESGAVYLRLETRGDALRAEVELGVVDALALLELPLDLADGWSAVEARTGALARRVADGIAWWSAGRPCAVEIPDPALVRAVDPGWLLVRLDVRCKRAIETLALRDELLFDLDPAHRAFVALRHGGQVYGAVLTAGARRADFDLRLPSAREQLAVYLREGVRHISTGYDHMLFLAALLLPAALERRAGRWAPRDRVRAVLVEVAAVVSAFTVAHSLTLSLAALDVVRLPRRFVESAIALSVLVAALNNFGPLVRARPWQLAFGFGLVHGFGFASQLGILGLPATAKGIALLGFNLGVEVGQLAVAAAVLPLVLALRRRRFYPTAVLEVPSVAIAWLAAVWLVERAFGIALLSWG